MSFHFTQERAASVIVNHWKPAFTQRYGHVFPESYLCIDLEYTGFNVDKDVIWEIGHVLVENRQVVDQLSIVLDWTDHPIVTRGWMRGAIERHQQSMANVGNQTRLSWGFLRQEGVKPERALEFYYRLLRTARSRGLALVGHNAYSTDERMLRAHFEGFLQRPFRLGDNALFDTGALEKASLAVELNRPAPNGKPAWWLPRADDTLRSYFSRVCRYPAKGVKWNLGDAIRRHGLDERYALDLEQCHQAQFDAYLSHLLMEHYRGKIHVSHAGESMLDGPEALQRGFEQAMAAKTEGAQDAERQQVRSARAPANFHQTRRRRQRPL